MYTGSATIPQSPAPLVLTVKKDIKGNVLNSIEITGMMELSKQVLNSKEGYVVSQGQRKEMSKEEMAEVRATATTFEELLLAKNGAVILDGIESISGIEAYAIKNGKTTLYYDVNTGLKLQEAKTIENGGQRMTITTSFADYKTVKGIKIPHELTMNQGIDLVFKLNDVKINEGVSDADFQ
jgi:hypothetical protein